MPLKRFLAACLLAALSLAGPVRASDLAGYTDVLWNHLKALAALGPRNPGSAGYRAAQDMIRSVGARYADAVVEQEFDLLSQPDRPVRMTNLILKFNGDGKTRPLLIGAHYDTRPFADEEFNPAAHREPIQGVNDGGSGTAILLGLARYLKEHPPRRPVHLVFFDGEDYGAKDSSDKLLGSLHYAKTLEQQAPGTWPYAVIVVDMVGDRDLEIYKEIHSLKNARWLVDLLFDAARKKNLPQFKEQIKYKIFDDHYPFIALGIPSVVLIDFDYPYWHTLADTLDKCSPESLAAAFAVVVEAAGEI
ncbi:MAG: M28 family peptidase [Nitrospinaceae bacterium]|nr:MAG: M28 family peptidase [Nitrospinaceae bacterium]